MSNYTFEELEKLSVAELEALKKEKMVELAEVRQGKMVLIGNILSFQGLIEVEKKKIQFNRNSLKEAFYHLYDGTVPDCEPVLVRGYFSVTHGGFVFGYNCQDGGGYVKLKDLSEDTIIKPVRILEG